MRISAYNQVAQLYGNQPVKTSYNSGAKGATSTKDQVSFSTVGKDMQIAKAALKDVPDVRAERVNMLKECIANGTYHVSAEDFANKILAAYDEKSI